MPITAWRQLQRQVRSTIYEWMPIIIQALPYHTFPASSALQNKKIPATVHSFLDSFMGELKHTIIGFLRSMVFAGLFPAFSRRIMCLVTQFYGFNGSTFIDKTGLLGIASGIGALSLLFEAKSRQSEIALYVTTKTIEIAHGYLKKHGFHLYIKDFEVWLFGFIMGVFGYFYQHEPTTMKNSYHSTL
jgi:hypothetical protein